MDTIEFENVSGIRTRKKMKKYARRTAGSLAGMFLVTVAFAYLLHYAGAFCSPYIAKAFESFLSLVFGTSAMQSHAAAQDLYTSVMFTEFVSMLSELLTFILPFALFSSKILSQNFGESFSVSGKVKPLQMIAIFACAQFMASSAAMLTDKIAGFIAPSFFGSGTSASQIPEVSLTLPDLAVYFLSLCVFTPIAEEYVFRGIMFKSLRKYGFGFAALASALIFGLAHGSVSQLAFAVAFGLVLAAVYEKNGNIIGCVLIHALNNASNFFFTVYLPERTDVVLTSQLNLIYNVITGVLAVIGFILLFSGGKKKTAAEPAGQKEQLLQEQQTEYSEQLIKFEQSESSEQPENFEQPKTPEQLKTAEQFQNSERSENSEQAEQAEQDEQAEQAEPSVGLSAFFSPCTVLLILLFIWNVYVYYAF